MGWDKYKSEITISNDMIRLGPTVLRDTVDFEKNLTCLGPVIGSGELGIGKLFAMGPVTINGNVKAISMHTLGPAIIHGNAEIETLSIKGPLDAGQIRANYVSLAGPVDVEEIDCEYIKIQGPIRVEKRIVASERIILEIGFTNNLSHYNIKELQAPIVEIRQPRLSSLPQLLKRVFNIGSGSRKMIDLDMNITTDTLILDGVRVHGQIEAKEIKQLNSTDTIGLLE
ncbi:MAG: hypothetical protein INQ03_15250 [Candidatus Heimdallarchaeota archaeon]|nr:hypothetical protein [Candidatus Heimdallarchaeota archaeon]